MDRLVVLLMVSQMDTSGDSPESCMWCKTSPDLDGSTDGIHLYRDVGRTVGWKGFGLEHLLGFSS